MEAHGSVAAMGFFMYLFALAYTKVALAASRLYPSYQNPFITINNRRSISEGPHQNPQT